VELDDRIRQVTEAWDTDWSRATIDLGELVLGLNVRDPRDVVGAGPIDDPGFESACAARRWLREGSPGALVVVDEQARFYPLAILASHEVVNDRFGATPVVVTYCPLCNTAVSFNRRVGGRELRFGTSGLLRNSDLVMWDDATVSLWQQADGQGLVGEFSGSRLEPVATAIVAFRQFSDGFPEGLVLAREATGLEYAANPYAGYSVFTGPYPGLLGGPPDETFPPMSRVVAVMPSGSSAKAYRFDDLRAAHVVNDIVADVPIVVFWGGKTVDPLAAATIDSGPPIGTGIAFDRRVGGQVLTFTSSADGGFVDGETGTSWTVLGKGISGPLAGEWLTPVTHRNDFWFAWAAFFPDAPVFELS
jgi:hypothetical protein